MDQKKPFLSDIQEIRRRAREHVEKGAVTEAMVASAARAGARLVLGRAAVLTPLARDRARAAGVEIEKER